MRHLTAHSHRGHDHQQRQIPRQHTKHRGHLKAHTQQPEVLDRPEIPHQLLPGVDVAAAADYEDDGEAEETVAV